MNKPTEQELAEELSIWQNAQFTYDIEPGMAIFDDKAQNYDAYHHRQHYQNQEHLAYAHVKNKEHMAAMGYQTSSNNMNYDVSGPSDNGPVRVNSRTSATPYHPYIVPNSTPMTSASSSPIATSFSATVPNRFNVPLEVPQEEAPTTPYSPVDDQQHEFVRLAAEEDKRRRNTAASARFRVKKKQREQALERTAQEMTEKAEVLESRVKELELEIKWLRSLIIEKDSRLLDVIDTKKSSSSSSSKENTPEK